MNGKIDKVKALTNQGYVPTIDITWTNKRLRGDEWNEKLEVGQVDAKCIAMVIDSAEVLVQEEFERRANSYDYEAKKKKSDIEASEREASQLARKRANWESLAVDFGSSSVRNVI
jgi:FtsZ-binding cell division protein ZapB